MTIHTTNGNSQMNIHDTNFHQAVN